MAEGARLESVYTATYRGFESPPHRHIQKKSSYESTGFFHLLHVLWGDENPRPGFDNWRQPVGQTANAESGLPAGRAKRVNPPSPPYSEKSSYESTGFFFACCTRYPAYKNIPGPIRVSTIGHPHIAGWRRKRLIRPTKKHSPVSRAMRSDDASVIGMKGSLAQCRTHAVVFMETDNTYHLIFSKAS